VITLAYWIAIHAITQDAIASRVFHTDFGRLSHRLPKEELARKAFYGRGHSNCGLLRG
jgi:hypothetical protein